MNALLRPWPGPHGGVPPFDRVAVEDFEPALQAAMQAQLAQIERIAAQAQPPDFENTFAALERSGREFARVASVYRVHSSTLKTPAFQAVERAMAPRLAAFQDRIVQNARLFARITAAWEASRDDPRLTSEQRRLAWLKYTDFTRSGARLDEPSKARLSQINQRLATLYTQFSQNVLADESERVMLLESERDLAGLPEAVRAGAAAAAAERGHAGRWAILNTRSSVEPFLAFSERRDLRERVWRTFCSRGDNGDGRDNKGAIAEIVRLRAERARLLGYPTHAHWRLERSMAGSPDRAMELMYAVWKPAVARAVEEIADMQALADAQGAGISIEPWDYRHYAEKVRKAKFDLDENEVKPYLRLEKPARGDVLGGGRALRPALRAARGPSGLPPGRARVGGDQRAGPRRPVLFRRLRAPRQEFRRMDERLPQPGTLRRARHHDRVQQRQLREGRARRARAHQLA